MFSRADRFNSKGPETPAPGAYDVGVGGSSSGSLSFDKSSRFKRNSSNDLADSANSSLLSISQTSYRTPRGRPNSGSKTKPHSSSYDDNDSATIIRQLEEQLRRLSCTCSDLTEQLLASANQVSTLQGRLDSELQEKYSLQEELSLLKSADKGAELEATVTRLKDKISTLKEHNTHLTQQLDTAMATSQDHEDQLFSLREETAAQRSESDCLREQLDQERVKLVATLTTHEQLVSELGSTHTQLLDKIRVLEEQASGWVSERDQLQECLGSTRAELVISKETVVQQQTEHQLSLEALTRKCQTLEEQAALQCHSETVLRDQLLSTQEAHTLLDKENQATLRALSTKETQLEETREETQATLRALSTKETHLEEAREDNQATLRALSTKETQLEEAREENQATLRALSTKETQLEEAREENQATLRALSTKETQLEEAREENQATLRALSTKETQLEEAREKNQATLRALSTKETQLEEAREELASVTTGYNKEKSSIEEQLRVAIETIQQVQRTRSSIEEELETDRQRGAEIEALHRASLEHATRQESSSDDEGTDSGVRVDHESLSDSDVKRLDRGDQAARIAELEAEIERLTQENDALKQAYAELEEKYAPYQDTIDKLEEQNKLLTSQTATAQQEAKRLSEQYAKLLGHQNTRQKIMHVKNLKDENAALKQEITKLKNEVTRQKRTITRLGEESGVKGKPLVPRN